MIVEIKDSVVARDFLNSVPFDEYVPAGFPVCNPTTIILGWHDPELVCMFPMQIYGDEIEIHCACKRSYRGKRAINAAHAAFDWIFSNTRFKTIYARISQRHVEIFALLCGMVRRGDRFEVTKWAAL